MTTTTNRGYSTPATGSQSGIWGSDDLNPNFTLIDKNLGAVSSVALTNSNVTLSSAQYACGTIKFTGTLSANVTITFPAVAGWWTIINNCTGNYYIRLSCSGGGLKICPPPGETIDIGFDGTDAFYRNLPHLIGGYWDYAGSSVPVWVSGCSVPPYLACDGSTFSAVTYPYLNTILGTTTLPDSRARVRIPLDGGTNRVTTAGSSIDGATRFASGGAQNVQLSINEMPAHAHPGSSIAPSQVVTDLTGNSINVSSGYDTYLRFITKTATSITIASQGGNAAHNNMPPAYVGGITMIRAA